MSFSNTAETAALTYIFTGTAVPWAANTDLWLAMYTDDPGEAGSAVTNEVSTGAWPSYVRVAVTRATELTVTGDTVTINVLKQFPRCIGGTSPTCKFASLVTTASGAGTIIGRYDFVDDVVVGPNVRPNFEAGDLTFTLT